MVNLKNAYESWLDNEVTQIFLTAVSDSILELQEQTKTGATLEQIGMNEIVRTANIEVLFKLKTWKPQELIDE